MDLRSANDVDCSSYYSSDVSEISFNGKSIVYFTGYIVQTWCADLKPPHFNPSYFTLKSPSVKSHPIKLISKFDIKLLISCTDPIF